MFIRNAKFSIKSSFNFSCKAVKFARKRKKLLKVHVTFKVMGANTESFMLLLISTIIDRMKSNRLTIINNFLNYVHWSYLYVRWLMGDFICIRIFSDNVIELKLHFMITKTVWHYTILISHVMLPWVSLTTYSDTEAEGNIPMYIIRLLTYWIICVVWYPITLVFPSSWYYCMPEYLHLTKEILYEIWCADKNRKTAQSGEVCSSFIAIPSFTTWWDFS